MTIFALKGSLEEITPAQLSEQTCSAVFITDSAHAEETLRTANITYEGVISLRDVVFCKIESQPFCLAGTLSIPKLLDIKGSRHRIQFFIDNKNMVIIDDEEFSLRLVQRIQRSRHNQGESREHFIYNFFSEFMLRDTELLAEHEQKLMELEENVNDGKTDDFLETITPIRKELLILRSYYDEIMDLGRELEEDENGFFEKFIEDNIINNNHEVVLSLVPKHGLAEKKEAKEAEQLAKYKATLSKEELEELVKQTKALKEYQDTPSSQKDLEKIPQLELKDITREPAKLYIDPKKTGGVDVIHHNMFTNGIAYIMMCYDCKNVPDELLPYIGLLSSVLGLMDTEKYTYTELTNEININCGGISTDAAIYTDNKDFDKCTIMYEVKGKVLYDNIQFVLDMMNEIIYKTKFSDYKRLKEIIAKLKSRMESTMTSAGHSTAMLAGMAQFSRNAYYSNEMRGYGFYELIQKLDSQFDELKEDIADKLSKLVDYIFHKENIIVSFTADDKGYDAFAPAFGKYVEGLKKSDMPACERKYTPANVKTGYTSASQVQYVARCGNFRDGEYEYTGALRVLKVIFSYDYLWINVRVKGGAYGCMSGSYRNGDMYMVSYRDPNLRKTNEIYENAADYLEHFDVSDRDMVKFIIGTIGDMDTPMNPAAKGTRSFGAYICNTDYESLKKERGQVLDCNVERIRELAPLVRCAMDENYFCVVGSSKEINKESELFDKIQPLIKVQG